MTIKFRGYAHGPNAEADSSDDMVAYLRVYFRDDPRGPVSSFKCEAYGADWMISGDHGVIGFCTAPIDINRRAPSEAATPFDVVSFEPWKDGVVRIRIAADGPEGRVCLTFYARQEYAPSEAVGLLRALLRALDVLATHGPNVAQDEREQARRFLAAQDKEST